MKKYIPKKGEKFRAFLNVEKEGKEHRGSPFVYAKSNDQVVNARDKDGLAVILRIKEFKFSPVAKPY